MGRGAGGNLRSYRVSAGERIKIAANRAEYNRLIDSGVYDASKSYFSKSGGYVLVNKLHNEIDKTTSDEDIAAIVLADAGFRVRLEIEKDKVGTKNPAKKHDGYLDDVKMEIKTLNELGRQNNRMARALFDADKQKGVNAVIISRIVPLSEKYIQDNIELYRKSSGKKNILERLYLIQGGVISRYDIK